MDGGQTGRKNNNMMKRYRLAEKGIEGINRQIK